MTLQPLQQLFELVEDSRFDEAIHTLDQHLALDPGDARLHALRAFLLIETGRPTEASTSVEKALALDAQDPYVHLAAAEVALARSDPAAGIAAARQVHALDPDDDAYIFLEARARAQLGEWDEVIARMDYILAGDQANEAAAIFRAMALEAKNANRRRFTVADWATLSRQFPLNPFARAGNAWRLLAAGQATAAEEEFRQAITVDPTSEWAKEGLVLTLKSKYPGYGLLLRFFFWLHTLAPRTRTWLAIGGVVGYNALRRIAAANPTLKPILVPVLVAYAVFVLASWLADPLLNLALMRHAEGRTALSEDDRRSGTRVGLCLAAAVILTVVALITPWDGAFAGAIMIGLTSLTVAGAYNCAPGRYRRRLLTAASAFAVLGLAATVVPDAMAGNFMLIVVLGVAVSTWVARSWAYRSWGEHRHAK
ncbi:MAG TPA: tetratricopeptide repeat protein [Gemmatimonadaceae bacterium]|nr:tetratricopeptide repeat protein [Gemmatimonadaceae bacterium]